MSGPMTDAWNSRLHCINGTWHVPAGATIRALTVHQPYADLLARGIKQVENRRRRFGHRGLLAIHAGMSHDWLAPGERAQDYVMGAVVAVGRLKACVAYDDPLPDYAWIHDHPHASGPYCLILEEVRRLVSPVSIAGQQGLWTWRPTASHALVGL